MSDSIDWALVDRYLAGELDEATAAHVRRWLMAHSGERDLLGTLGRVLDGDLPPDTTLGAITDADARRSWATVAARMAAVTRPRGLPHVGWGRRGTPPRRWLVGAIATAGAAAVVAFAWFATTRARIGTPSTPPRVYATAIGQHASFTLADGSTVLLGDASRMTVPADFGAATRTVSVDGEAYFTVTHTAGVPFIVRTTGAATRVLGTTFMARRYTSDSRTRIVVADGRVAFGATIGNGTRHALSIAEVVLPAGVMAELSDSGRMAVMPNVALEEMLDWTRGRLVFRNTLIRDAIPRLERRYGVRIVLADTTLAAETLTSTFINEPLTQVLDVLALTFPATYTRSGPEGRVITFTPGPRSVRRLTPLKTVPAILPEVSYGK